MAELLGLLLAEAARALTPACVSGESCSRNRIGRGGELERG
jgi:hypothetical protein